MTSSSILMELFEIKNRFYKNLYSVLKNLLFCFDPEMTHRVFLRIGKIIDCSVSARRGVSLVFDYQHPCLEQRIFGINFKNPIGLSAGFDKNADLINVMGSVGFGFVEVGSVTACSYEGNKGIRLRRILNKNSLWVNLGLNNEGALNIRNKLKNKKFDIPFGINIARTNCPETVNYKMGLKDYIYSLKTFRNEGDYFTINISCPNAFGGQPFSSPKTYKKLLEEVDRLNIKKPIFVKLSPDLSKRQIDVLLDITLGHKVSGFICTNLTKDRKVGGYSGKAVEGKSNILLSYIYKKIRESDKKYILIGSGGVFSAEDAYRKIKLGANLVQLITGMIYRGPNLISEINYNVVKLLKKDGFNNIEEAVGTANNY